MYSDNSKLIIPEKAVPYILVQRTKLQTANKISALLPLPYWIKVLLEAKIRSKTIKAGYSGQLEKEYYSLKKYLPEKMTRVLDIGCGVGGINVYIWHHYSKRQDIEFYLLDRTEVAKKIYYGFEAATAFYNSLEISKRVLIENGVPEKNIYLVEAGKNHQVGGEKLNLVLSLYSWGFHYPISAYLNQVYEAMSNQGVLIVDIRKDSGGDRVLKKRFNNLKIISTTNYALRVSATKSQ